jgi:hypothetical protein
VVRQRVVPSGCRRRAVACAVVASHGAPGPATVGPIHRNKDRHATYAEFQSSRTYTPHCLFTWMMGYLDLQRQIFWIVAAAHSASGSKEPSTTT